MREDRQRSLRLAGRCACQSFSHDVLSLVVGALRPDWSLERRKLGNPLAAARLVLAAFLDAQAASALASTYAARCCWGRAAPWWATA